MPWVLTAQVLQLVLVLLNGRFVNLQKPHQALKETSNIVVEFLFVEHLMLLMLHQQSAPLPTKTGLLSPQQNNNSHKPTPNLTTHFVSSSKQLVVSYLRVVVHSSGVLLFGGSLLCGGYSGEPGILELHPEHCSFSLLLVSSCGFKVQNKHI